MAKRVTYSDTQKAMFVNQLLTLGYPDNRFAIGEIRREYGKKAPSVPALTRWYKTYLKEQDPDFNAIVKQEKESSLERFDRIVFLSQKHLLDLLNSDDALEHISARDLMIIAGTGTDKRRLLAGESTDNNATEIVIRYGNQTD